MNTFLAQHQLSLLIFLIHLYIMTSLLKVKEKLYFITVFQNIASPTHLGSSLSTFYLVARSATDFFISVADFANAISYDIKHTKRGDQYVKYTSHLLSL